MPDARFDVIIIGSGPAGLAAAEAVRERGAKSVAIVEAAKRLGGECPNWGCVPTKAFLRSSEVLREAQGAGEFGIQVTGVEAHFDKIFRRKTKIVDGLTNDKRMLGIVKNLGLTLVRGKAEFVSPDTIRVGRKRMVSDRIIIATGSKAFIPPIDELQDVPFWTSDDLVELKTLPKSMVIIGGGPIGVEFAEFFNALGTEVSIVEFAPHLVPREDPEIAEILEKSFKKRKIGVYTGMAAEHVESRSGGVVVKIKAADKTKKATKTIAAEHLVIATGKRPAVDSLALDKAKIKVDERGAPKLDKYLRTSNRRVYLAGDAAGQMMFTHVAHMQGEVAGENAMRPRSKASDLRVIPRGTFCTPEIGSVGVTEAEARDKGYAVVVGRGRYDYLGKSLVTGKTEGIAKIIVNKKTKTVLGGHVIGHSAAELVHEIALAMQANISVQAMADMVHAYPTYAEVIGLAAWDAAQKLK